MKISKQSLMDRIRNISASSSIPVNSILQNYFFEAFLKRLSESEYSDKFIIKGGFLLSSVLGLSFRSTMDIDFQLKEIVFSEKVIHDTIRNIISIQTGDGVVFDLLSIRDIRKEDAYGGFAVSLLGKLENIKVPVDIDVVAGDPITPSPILYEYESLFDGTVINLRACNFETIIAEKLQTILVRGASNSRMKDFYDVFIIYRLRFETIDIDELSIAFSNTCRHRGTIFDKKTTGQIIKEISESGILKDRWERYTNKYQFAKEIKYEEIVSILLKLVPLLYQDAA